jgi:hypothetical protein
MPAGDAPAGVPVSGLCAPCTAEQLDKRSRYGYKIAGKTDLSSINIDNAVDNKGKETCKTLPVTYIHPRVPITVV